MRYMLFCGSAYYPQGGAFDLVAQHDDLNKGYEKLANLMTDTRYLVVDPDGFYDEGDDDNEKLEYAGTTSGWYHILDTHDCKIVAKGHLMCNFDYKVLDPQKINHEATDWS